MNMRQNNKLVSYHATLAALEAIPEVDSIPGLSGELDVFRTKMGEVLRLAQTQEEAVAGKRARRDQLLDEMAEAAVEIATVVAAYADKHRLTELAPRVRVRPGDFARARTVSRPVLARTVLDAAREVLPDLGPYGVTAERLDELERRIAAAVDGIHQPRTGMVERKAATARLLALLDEIDELLGSQVDRLLYAVRRKHPQAYAGYRAARAIVDRPATRKPSEPVLPPAPTQSEAERPAA